ncbi:MAG: sugar ABC transporter substrate-binding protein [Lachnospiraceae bacterium]|nr:sugar ABC transporter substrate-binding protein [Lachnospiraceae bacterium]
MKKKVLYLLLSTVMVTMAACGGSSSDEGTTDDKSSNESSLDAEASNDEQVTLRLALWDYEVDGPTTYDPIIEAFEKANPNISIEVVGSPSADYETKLTTMLSGGDNVDLFFAKSNTALPGLQSKGFCMDLTPLFEQNEYDLSNYGTVIDQHMTFGGDVYALPFRTNDWVLFYNKDIFDAAGVNYPSDDMTWEEVGELAKEITEKTEEGIYGFSFFPKTGFIFPVLAGTEDGFDITTSDLSCMTKALDWILDMQESGAMEEYAESVSMSKDQTYFFKGEWAMIYDGSWFVQNMNNQEDLGFEWGIAKSPYWEGTQKNGFVTSTPLCISATTEHTDEAYKFLTFVCGEEGASILAKTNLVPGFMDDTVLEAYKENLNLDESSIAALVDNVTYSFGKPNTVFSQIISAGQKEMELVLTGNETPEEFVENFEAQRAELIESAE